MVALQVNHVADQFPTYPLPLDLSELAKMPMAELGTGYFPTTLLEYVEKKGTDPGLAQALRTALSADPGIDAWLTASPQARDRLFRLHARLQEANVQLWTVEKRLDVAQQRASEIEAKLAEAHERLQPANTELARLAANLAEAQQQIQAANAQSARLAAQLYRLTSSQSWRLTAPLRSLSAVARNVKGKEK